MKMNPRRALIAFSFGLYFLSPLQTAWSADQPAGNVPMAPPQAEMPATATPTPQASTPAPSPAVPPEFRDGAGALFPATPEDDSNTSTEASTDTSAPTPGLTDPFGDPIPEDLTGEVLNTSPDIDDLIDDLDNLIGTIEDFIANENIFEKAEKIFGMAAGMEKLFKLMDVFNDPSKPTELSKINGYKF